MGWVGGNGGGLVGGAPSPLFKEGAEGGEAKEGGKRGGLVGARVHLEE